MKHVGEWRSTTTQLYASAALPPVPTEQATGWVPEPAWTLWITGHFFLMLGTEPRLPTRPTCSSHYSDWAIPVLHKWQYTSKTKKTAVTLHNPRNGISHGKGLLRREIIVFLRRTAIKEILKHSHTNNRQCTPTSCSDAHTLLLVYKNL